MRVVDVMTTNVIQVDPEMTVKAAAKLLVDHGVSGAPVVDAAQHVVGMISEGDMLQRPEIGTEPRRRSWWLDLVSSNRELTEEYIKSHGHKVKDVMTDRVISVGEATPLGEVAALLEARRIKRVPVLRDGKLVGIVSRANLVQALASTIEEPVLKSEVKDQEIRAKLLTELKAQKWAGAASGNILVRNGIVHLWGFVWAPEESQAMRILAEGIPGVRGVENHTEGYPVFPGF
jgi:CBS domain-containing protein